MESLSIEGAWVCTPRIYRDDRGAFLENFSGDEFAADVGYRLTSRRPTALCHGGTSSGESTSLMSRRGRRNTSAACVAPSWTSWSTFGSAPLYSGRWEAVPPRRSEPALGLHCRRARSRLHGIDRRLYGALPVLDALYVRPGAWRPPARSRLGDRLARQWRAWSCPPRMSARRRWPKPCAADCFPATPSASPTRPACATMTGRWPDDHGPAQTNAAFRWRVKRLS